MKHLQEDIVRAIYHQKWYYHVHDRVHFEQARHRPCCIVVCCYTNVNTAVTEIKATKLNYLKPASRTTNTNWCCYEMYGKTIWARQTKTKIRKAKTLLISSSSKLEILSYVKQTTRKTESFESVTWWGGWEWGFEKADKNQESERIRSPLTKFYCASYRRLGVRAADSELWTIAIWQIVVKKFFILIYHCYYHKRSQYLFFLLTLDRCDQLSLKSWQHKTSVKKIVFSQFLPLRFFFVCTGCTKTNWVNHPFQTYPNAHVAENGHHLHCRIRT